MNNMKLSNFSIIKLHIMAFLSNSIFYAPCIAIFYASFKISRDRELFVYMSIAKFIKQIYIKLNMHNLKKFAGHMERNFIFKDLASRFSKL